MTKRDYIADMREYINSLEHSEKMFTRDKWREIIENEMKDNGLEVNGIEIGWIIDTLDLEGYVIFENNRISGY